MAALTLIMAAINTLTILQEHAANGTGTNTLGQKLWVSGRVFAKFDQPVFFVGDWFLGCPQIPF